jgi:hypothetical protein
VVAHKFKVSKITGRIEKQQFDSYFFKLSFLLMTRICAVAGEVRVRYAAANRLIPKSFVIRKENVESSKSEQLDSGLGN